jgi:hypothetical protein
MRKRRLAVAGCSISDRTKTTHCYGDYLAQHLDLDYLHFASGSGSNHRSLRKITDAVMSGELQAGDIVVMQITDPTRRELQSAWLSQPNLIKIAKQHVLQSNLEREDAQAALGGSEGQAENLDVPNLEVIDGKSVYTKFKQDSYTWQETEKDKLLHEATQQYGVDWYLSASETRQIIELLRGYLAYNQIQFMVIWEHLGMATMDHFLRREPAENLYKHPDLILHEVWQEIVADDYSSNPQYQQYHLEPNVDWVHYSITGHKKIADVLCEHIREHFTI